MAERIPQSATIRVPLQAYLTSDHVSAATGKTIAITISKNGGAYGNPSGGATNAVEIASGSYYVDLSTTDTGTLGPLFVLGAVSGVDNIIAIYDVVKATNGGLSALPDTAVSSNASLLTSGSSTDQLTVSGGIASADAKKINAVATTSVTTISANQGTTQPLNFTGTGASALVKSDMVDIAGAAVSTSTAQIGANVVSVAGAASNIKKGQALSGFEFIMTDATTHAPKTGLTITSTVSHDGGAFASTTNSASEIANGWYTLNLSTTDMNGNNVALRFTASGADDQDVLIITQP